MITDGRSRPRNIHVRTRSLSVYGTSASLSLSLFFSSRVATVITRADERIIRRPVNSGGYYFSALRAKRHRKLATGDARLQKLAESESECPRARARAHCRVTVYAKCGKRPGLINSSFFPSRYALTYYVLRATSE